MRRTLLTLAALLLFHVPASATWSVIAMDTVTGQVVIASATCVPQARFANFPAKGLMDIQAIVVPGIAVAAAQAGVDNTRANQQLIYRELRRGTPPAEIIGMLSADPQFERRQFAIVDKQGRTAGHSGSGNGYVSEHMPGPVPGTNIVFSVQGNILASHQVVQQAARAFREGDGSMVERVMRAMEVADAEGGDRRCTCASEPLTASTRACTIKTSNVAYLLVADADDASGASFNDGEYSLFIDVHDQNIRADEDANPVKTLRMRYEAWKRENGEP